jgi:hypothetical protein
LSHLYHFNRQISIINNHYMNTTKMSVRALALTMVLSTLMASCGKDDCFLKRKKVNIYPIDSTTKKGSSIDSTKNNGGGTGTDSTKYNKGGSGTDSTKYNGGGSGSDSTTNNGGSDTDSTHVH